MRFRQLLLGFALACTTAVSAQAQPGPQQAAPEPATAGQSVPVRAVLELFTSQGCSSCPAADAVLKSLSTDPSIIALSLPVDYWDYLGWKDTFASPRNTERQKNYAKVRGDGAIFTPQVVVNGMLHVNGRAKADIQNAIEETANDPRVQHVPLKFWQEHNTLNIRVGAADPSRPIREATVWLAIVQTDGSIDIKGGENAGKQLTYTNVVRDMTPIGLWKGQPMEIQIPRAAVMLPDTQKSVVLIQEGRAGPIIGAAWAGLW